MADSTTPIPTHADSYYPNYSLYQETTMTMPLFLDQDLKPVFQKLASPVKLSDNPDNWQMEIGSELYKQLPFLTDYAVNVILERMSPERGYAFGSAEVNNKSESPVEHQPKAFVRIPIIVKDRLMQPPDVMLAEGKAYPCTETRLREHLMRTDAFEMTTRKPPDQGMVDQLYPPLRTNYGYGNAVATGVGMGGFGKQASLLEQIAPTLDEHQVDAFIAKIAGDRELGLMALRNLEFQKLAYKLAAVERVPMAKQAETLVGHIKPTVVQFVKLANGKVKMSWANRNAFFVKTAEVAPEQANAMMGEGAPDMAKMPEGAAVTVSTEKPKKEKLIEEVYEKVTSYGEYKVHSESGEELEGFVMPIIDFEMQPLDLYLWSDSQGQYAVQDEIAGAKQDHSPENIPEVEPEEGDGCFYFHEPAGARALLPMTIHHVQTDPDGLPCYVGEDVFGEPVTITKIDGIESIEAHAPGSYLIPQGCMWLPLQNPIHLVKNAEELEGETEAKNAGGAAEIKATGPEEVSVDGPPMAKVADKDKRFLKHAEAEFLLVACGANPFQVREKLAQAHKGYTVKLGGLRPIQSLSLLHQEMTKKAARILGDSPYRLRTDLVKEAAALEGSETVDNILSLNFINPENISTFANNLPALDATAQKLAELLMAARMGMSNINEGACERAMKNLDKVIDGLKELQVKSNEPSEE